MQPASPGTGGNLPVLCTLRYSETSSKRVIFSKLMRAVTGLGVWQPQGSFQAVAFKQKGTELVLKSVSGLKRNDT